MTAITPAGAPQGLDPAVNVGLGRWGYLIGGIVLLLAMGLVYAWSIFVAPLEREFGWTRSETSLAFSICMSMFCAGVIATGLLTKKITARTVIWLSALLVGGGFVGASRLSTLGQLYFFYGGLIGLGVGMAYNGVLSTIMRWFPERPGLISGLLMMGFGLGALILGTVGTYLIDGIGWRLTFRNLGFVYLAVIIVSSFFIKLPGPSVVLPRLAGKGGAPPPADRDWATSEMVRRPTFWLFFAWAVILGACGLIVISNAAPMARSLGAASMGGLLTGLIAVFNGLGRVLTGLTYDRIGRHVAMPALCLGFIAAGALLILGLRAQSVPLLFCGCLLTGTMYGGMPTSASTVIRLFYGLRHYSLNFSLINLNVVFASFLGPYLSGVLLDRTGSYQTTFLAIIVFGALSLGLNFMIRRP
ncbi:MAG: MFS transporter [Deltaproteobacteria bacterium]|jgi:OFA family oxalate/formate antiporter-like MFS transporter|nr:MFS transporter [Deltaproteobacteria bacterium]